MGELTLLPAAREHLDALEALERACFSVPWSRRSLSELLESPLARVFVARQDGAVCGYIGALALSGEVEVTNAAVFPEHRRRGIGAALVDALLDAARAEGAQAVLLEVRASNEAALALYRSRGFRAVGERKNYYREPVENAVLMTCRLFE